MQKKGAEVRMAVDVMIERRLSREKQAFIDAFSRMLDDRLGIG